MALIVVLTNVSNLAPISDYHYEVSIGDGMAAGSKTIAYGTIEGHVREDGWQHLVQTLLNKERVYAE